MAARQDRLIIFADPNIASSRILLAAFLRELALRPHIHLTAICDTARKAPPPEWLRASIAWCRNAVQNAFNPSLRDYPIPSPAAPRAPLLVPPERNINHTAFLARLRQELRPTLALTVTCLQIFKPPLLDSFEMAVNYHDGYLPFYKGLGATAWSIYHREPTTGYTYHRMNSAIDAGAILLQGSLPIDPDATPQAIRYRKHLHAAANAGRVLDLMSDRAKGAPQNHPGSYFSAADGRRIRTIDPTQLTAAEIHHRLRAFEILNIQIQGRLYEVTALTESPSPLSFTTQDGVTLSPHRLLWLPPALYRLYRTFRPTRS